MHRAFTQSQPDHTHEPASPESPDPTQLQLEVPQITPRQPVRDALGERAVDVAQKAEREVQVPGWCEAEIWRRRRARLEVRRQRVSLRLRHRQPEEGANG